MIKSVNDLHGTAIEATDGHIGAIHDVYFDDQAGNIRYFVVDTAKWLPGRKVLIPPEAIVRPWVDGTGLPVNLTREQVRSSPDIDTQRPVSRDAELLLYSHYNWAPYWPEAVLPPPPPQFASSIEEKREAEATAEHMRSSHLRSCREVMGYQVHGTDGKAGTLDDILIDPEESRIRYFVVKTGEWPFHKQVLVSPDRIGDVNWAESKIDAHISRHQIETCPAYKSLVA